MSYCVYSHITIHITTSIYSPAAMRKPEKLVAPVPDPAEYWQPSAHRTHTLLLWGHNIVTTAEAEAYPPPEITENLTNLQLKQGAMHVLFQLFKTHPVA